MLFSISCIARAVSCFNTGNSASALSERNLAERFASLSDSSLFGDSVSERYFIVPERALSTSCFVFSELTALSTLITAFFNSGDGFSFTMLRKKSNNSPLNAVDEFSCLISSSGRFSGLTANCENSCSISSVTGAFCIEINPTISCSISIFFIKLTVTDGSFNKSIRISGAVCFSILPVFCFSSSESGRAFTIFEGSCKSKGAISAS